MTRGKKPVEKAKVEGVRKTIVKKTPSKTPKDVKETVDVRPYDTKKITIMPSMYERVEGAYLCIVVSSIEEFKDHQIYNSRSAFREIGFTFENDREFDMYHEGRVVFTRYFLEYKGTTATKGLRDLIESVWQVYEKYHVDFTDLHLVIETNNRLILYDWEVCRFNTGDNIGIIRDMKQVLKYRYNDNKDYLDIQIEKGVIKMVEMKKLDKDKLVKVHRPFNVACEEYPLRTRGDYIKINRGYVLAYVSREMKERYYKYAENIRTIACNKIIRAWRKYHA